MSVPDDTLPEYEDYEDFYDESGEGIDDTGDFTDSSRSLDYRAASSDPTFGYLIVLALAVGLTALPPDQRDLRYTVVWMVPAGFGVLAWLFGKTIRFQEETPENLAWGIAFALIVATPLLAVGGSTLTTTVNLLFRDMSWGTLLAYLVFVMPLAETLFFRGVLQHERAVWMVGLMSSLWSTLLFFPLLNVGTFPAIAAVIALAFLMMNMTYSYVRRRNGLAAAWICQIVVNLVLIFVPYISS
ncbi:MAG: CPBP family intramembrane metalloprotease [Anaerolineae bacterium]|nr:CPBP family intramembrane metalloprotease [Anaerolineae bacterium]